jgi:alpha-glucosidase
VQENIRRRFINQRYRLLPYFYTTAEEASRTGIPVLRPLFLEFPDATPDRSPLDLTAGNEFLLGPDILVAPPPYPDEVQSYAVTFPPVPWYDYWTGRLMTKSAPAQLASLETATVIPQLDTLPVYVRGGSIVPLQPLVQSTSQTPQGPLELRVYPGPNCHGSLYQDDGVTFDYKRGDFLRVGYTCQAQTGSLRLHIGAQSGNYPAWWKSIEVAVFNWPSAQVHATLNGREISGSAYDAATRVLRLQIPQSTAASDLVLTADSRR